MTKAEGSASTPIRNRRSLRLAVLGAAVLGGLCVLSFAWNGLETSWRSPRIVDRGRPKSLAADRTLRVLAFNAAKCEFHEGGVSFASERTVRLHIDEIAATIERERPDLVFLSEIVSECGPVDVDQVAVLAARSGFRAFASSDNYSFGLPFFRIRSGNAILSNLPLRAVAVEPLAGEKPFWKPTNNRRALWCEVEIEGVWLLVGSLRNDSFDALNNERQMAQILAFIGARPALLAGDFNATPDSKSIEQIRQTGHFAASRDQNPTFPRGAATRRIDYAFGPAAWRVLAERVIDCGTSDHLAVVADFQVR